MPIRFLPLFVLLVAAVGCTATPALVTPALAGTGSPMFDGIENVMARALFGIPAVKGVEFGRGFEVARMTGTQNNDPYEVRDGACVPVTNNAGGILGGISSGQPIVAHLALKPTSSITTPGRSIDVDGNPVDVITKGRHDPCVGIRATPIAEAMLALVLMDQALRHRAQCGDVGVVAPRIPGSLDG